MFTLRRQVRNDEIPTFSAIGMRRDMNHRISLLPYPAIPRPMHSYILIRHFTLIAIR